MNQDLQPQEVPEVSDDSQSGQNTQAEPSLKQGIQTFKENIRNAPSNVGKAINDGKGNMVFSTIQDMLVHALQILNEGCRQVTIQQYLLSDISRTKISMCIYVISFILAVLLGALLLFDFTLKGLLLCLEFPLAALIADRLLNKFVVTKKTRRRAVKQSKRQDTDDYL